LQKKLKEVADWQQLAICTEAGEALRTAEAMQPDVIFLDISMPERSGLEIARDMEEVCPNSAIVFVTAFDEHALAAFEANAIDYMLKPVETKRLARTVQKLKIGSAVRKANAPIESESVQIRCFPLLRYTDASGTPCSFKWRTTKAEELFAFLVHQRGRTVSRDKLIEAIWPDIDPHKAAVQLYTAVYQMRQGLKKSGLPITVENVRLEEGYRIPSEQVCLESTEWERELLELRDLRDDDSLERLWKRVEQYEGDYLGEYDYIWAEEENVRLRSLWTLHALRLTEALLSKRRYRDAATIAARILRMQPYCEEAHFFLLQSYDGMGDFASVMKHYQVTEGMFQEELGVGLHERIEQWFKHWFTSRSERTSISIN
jgi:two-component SAPR family response regulator